MSPDINALIKRLKTLKVRGIGVVSQARRALTIAEFCKLVCIAQRDDSIANYVEIPIAFNCKNRRYSSCTFTRAKRPSSLSVFCFTGPFEMDQKLFGGAGCSRADNTRIHGSRFLCYCCFVRTRKRKLMQDRPNNQS
jgi:hypothetical protein